MQKIKNILKYIILSIFIFVVLFCFFIFFVTDILKKDYVNVFGFTSFVVQTGSMSGTIEANDIVIVKITSDVSENDIITFKSSRGKIITHRLISVVNGQYTTKGDQNQELDDNIIKEQIIGKVIYHFALETIVKIIVLVLLLYIMVSIIDYEFVLKKYIRNRKNIETLPDSIFKNPKKVEEASTGLTVTISIDEMEKMEQVHNQKLNEEDIEVLDEDVLSYEEMKKKEKEEYENETIDIIISVLKCKNSTLEKARMNKKWVEKYQYVYRLCQLLLVNNSSKIISEIENPPFEEIFDYDLEKVGLTKTIRNRIYNMPIYVFMNVLTHCTLYNDKEMFDGIYKILKYKVLVRDNGQLNYLNLDKSSMKKMKEFVSFMETIPNRFDNKDVFQLEKIEKLIKIGEY